MAESDVTGAAPPRAPAPSPDGAGADAERPRERRARRRLPGAFVFGLVAATLEVALLAALLYC